jgi:predicted ArsR family transcriptional regulator
VAARQGTAAVAETKPVTGLRTEIHAHLRQHPWLTANEVGRVIGRSAGGVRKALARMAHDGEAESRTRPRADGDARPAVEWRAT